MEHNKSSYRNKINLEKLYIKNKDRIDTVTTILILLVVIFSLLTQSYIISQHIAYIVTFGVYLFIAVISSWNIIISDTPPLQSRYAYGSFAVIALVFIFHLFTEPTFEMTQRVPIYIIIGILNIFIIPLFIRPKILFGTITIVSVGLILMGLPTIILGPISFGPLLIQTWHAPASLPLIGVFNPIMSVLYNPNIVGFLGLVGMIYLFSHIQTHSSRYVNASIGILTLGILFSMSRAIQLLTVSVIFLYIIARITPQYIYLLSVGGIVAAIGGLVVTIIAAESVLNGREALWPAAVAAIIQQPIIGYGPNAGISVMAEYVTIESQVGRDPHNSYLRIGLMGGLLSLVSYCLLFGIGWSTISRQLDYYSTPKPEELYIFLLLVVIILIQLFAGMTIFGISGTSVISALILGYALTPSESWGYYTNTPNIK